jgi:hypothetical protein
MMPALTSREKPKSSAVTMTARAAIDGFEVMRIARSVECTRRMLKA